MLGNSSQVYSISMTRNQFKMSLIIILTITTCTLSTAQEIDITPGGNFSFKFPYYSGPCPNVSSYLLSCNKSVYEGRWYAKWVSYTSEKAHSLSCYVWDSFFTQNGSFYNFISLLENGERKTMTTVSTPISEERGIYLLYAGSPIKTMKVFSTLFYTDGEMFVFWDTVCRDDGANHTRNALFGYRDLNLVRDKANQTRRIKKIVQERGGGPIDFYAVRHDEDCDYPPPMENPFK